MNFVSSDTAATELKIYFKTARTPHFTIVVFDGFHVGLEKSWNETYLEFDEFEDAADVARWWDAWIDGIDL